MSSSIDNTERKQHSYKYNLTNDLILFLSLAGEDEGLLVKNMHPYAHIHCTNSSSSWAQTFCLCSSCWVPGLPITGTWTNKSLRLQPHSSC